MTKLNQFLIYDELPLWSAPFGLKMLDTIRTRKNIRILDIGSGSGFPMLEIAERFGTTCRVTGVDPSDDAVTMIREKIRLKGISNAEIVKAEAEAMPFADSFFDLIVANNGLNNVRDVKLVLQECHRVAASGAQMVLTMNLPHTLSCFYDVLRQTLKEIGLQEEIRKMEEHISSKRKPAEWWKERIIEAGFRIVTIDVDGFMLRFADGPSFFRHYFIRTAFLPPWKEFLPEEWEEIFSRVERKLDEIATVNGSVDMQVPYACFDCRK